MARAVSVRASSARKEAVSTTYMSFFVYKGIHYSLQFCVPPTLLSVYHNNRQRPKRYVNITLDERSTPLRLPTNI